MPVTVVVGTQWGDEGKAKITDHLAKENDYVVRYQGGHNAGHTVVVGGERFALQLVPSGVFYDHVKPVIANGVVVDPAHLLGEIDALEARGIDCSRLVLSSHAHLIFPWHQVQDALAEAVRGAAKIGTTLKGIGPAYADKARRVGIRAGDLLDRPTFRERFAALAAAESEQIVRLGGEPLDVAALTETYSGEIADRVAPLVADTVNLLHDALDAGSHLLLEGAQATFLDLDHGTYPYVTSSNPTAGGACTGTGIGPRAITRVVGITKAYCTRVGAGPFPSEDLGDAGERMADIGHEFGTVTGRRRRTGWLDTAMLRHAVRLNSLTELALTKIDVLDEFATVRVCVGYERGGRRLTAYPERTEDLAEVTPIYEELPGWQRPLRDCRQPGDLPAEARDFLDLVRREAGVPIHLVGTGPDRDHYVQFG